MRFHLKALPSTSHMWFIAMVSLHLVVIPRLFYVNAQAPVNDFCSNALPIVIASNANDIPLKFNTTYSTTDLDVADDCLSGGPPVNKGIWFNFTGTGRRIVARDRKSVV